MSRPLSTAEIAAGARDRAVRRVTLVGAALDLALGAAKIAGGALAQSQALIADGVHSLSDLLTDGVVLLASREGHRAPDSEHPYGHGRIETLGTVAVAVSLVLVAVGIGYDAVARLFEPERLLQPGVWALAIALGLVVSKEWIYRYTMRAARIWRSDLLRANAWHSRSDAISSLFVIIGVSGSLAGLNYVDAVAAVAVAVMVAKVGIDLLVPSVGELIDAGLAGERLDAIKETIVSVDGVRALHLLRTRRAGGQAFVDVHILLSDPRLSVSEGHQISETVRALLIDRIEEVSDVTVHIDPEDDEVVTTTRKLPLREEVMAQLRARWAGLPLAEEITDIRLHYLDGALHLEIVLPIRLAGDRPGDLNSDGIGDAVERIRAELMEPLGSDPDLGELRVLFE